MHTSLRPFSTNFSSARLIPSSNKSESLTVSPERVLNFFLFDSKCYTSFNTKFTCQLPEPRQIGRAQFVFLLDRTIPTLVQQKIYS